VAGWGEREDIDRKLREEEERTGREKGSAEIHSAKKYGVSFRGETKPK